MKTIVLILALAVLIPLMPGQAQAASAAADTALDQSLAQAATYMERGRAPEAYELYMNLLRAEPDDDRVNLGLARAAAASGRYNQSVMAYERLLEKYPDETSLRRELAEAYMALQDRPGAERVLDTLRSLDASVGLADTDQALKNMEDRHSLTQFHGRIRFGAIYDSNANQGPISNKMNLGIWRVEVPGASSMHTAAVYLGVDLDLAHRFERDSDWWVVGDLRTYLRGNANSDLKNSSNRHSEWLRGAFGLRRLGYDSLWDFRVKGEVLDYEFSQNVTAVGPEFIYLKALTPSLQLITRGGLEHRSYSEVPERDGTYGSAGQFARVFFGQAGHSLTFGGRYLGGSANDHDYSYDAVEASVNAAIKVTDRLELGPFATFTREYYDGPATALETKKRKDKRRVAGTTLTYDLSEAWAVELLYQYTKNESDSELYEYKQHTTSLGLAWKF